MGKMGFGEKWIKLIRWYLSIASFSILVNGTPSGFFQSSRVLKQRGPVSPYLFVIALEALSCLLKKAVEGGCLILYKVRGRGNEGFDISHFLFLDDTLIFFKASKV